MGTSLDRFTFIDEDQPKGWALLEYDTDGSVCDTHMQVDARRFATLAPGDDPERFEPGTLVRVVCGDGTAAGDVNRERIADAGLVLVGVSVDHVDRDLGPYAGSAPAEPVLSPGGLLEEWCEAEGLEGDDMYAVLDKANALLGWQ